MFIRMPDSPASEFVLAEEDGYTLTLKDRFLPYRPVTIGGKQRAEFTWYPGSPEATVQMLGPEEDSIQLRGFWKDKFFDVQSVYRIPSNPADAVAAAIYSVSDLVQAVDDMRRMGRRIKLAWSGLERVGHIVAFRQTWHNVHDCEWEIDFAVVSQGENTVPSVSAVAVTVPDLYTMTVNKLAEYQDKLLEAAGVDKIRSKTAAFSAALNAADAVMTGTANVMIATAQGYANLVLSPSQALRRSVSTLTGGVKNLAVAGGSIADAALSELYSWGAFGAEDNTAPGQVIAAFNYKRILSDQVQLTRYTYASQAALAAQQATGAESQVQTYTAPANLDYRDVATKFYGTPNDWIALMQYNAATDSKISAGTVVFVPPRTLLNGGGRVGREV